MAKLLFILLLFQIPLRSQCQVETVIKDSTLCHVLDEFLTHLKNNGEFENAIIRIQLRAYSTEPGITFDSLKIKKQ